MTRDEYNKAGDEIKKMCKEAQKQFLEWAAETQHGIKHQKKWFRMAILAGVNRENPPDGFDHLVPGALRAYTNSEIHHQYNKHKNERWEYAMKWYRDYCNAETKRQDEFKKTLPTLEEIEAKEAAERDKIFTAGELEYRTLDYPDGRKVKRLVLPVTIHQYPEGFDELIGRAWISNDSTVSMSVVESYGMKHRETVTDAKELTFILSQSYKWEDKSPVRFDFYFREENVMFKKTGIFEIKRDVPGKASLLGAVQDAVKASASCSTPNIPDAQWFLPVPAQSILDFRVVELQGDYWLFWHDDSHANDGMLPGFDEPNFNAKVWLNLEIEHYADPVSQNYWSCGQRSPYKIPKEAIDRHFISLRYRWMTDPNDYGIMSGHWGEKTLTTNGAGTFEQLLEEGISNEYILSQSIEQFNQIRGVPGTLTYAPGTEPAEEQIVHIPAAPDSPFRQVMEHADLMAQLLEEGPESWVVNSVNDLPDWYWTLDKFDMDTGSQWGKIQIAPGHYVYYDGSGPRGRWNVPPMKNVEKPEVLPTTITGKGTAKPPVSDVREPVNIPDDLAEAIEDQDWIYVIKLATERLL